MLILHIKLLIVSLLLFISPLTAPVGAFFLLWMAFTFMRFWLQYRRSCYGHISNHSLWKVYFDKGLYGEFLTVIAVEGIREQEQILVNVYLNRANNESKTTEVDVIYINSSGIFVLESKNYSGWIFGNEKSNTWTQMLNKHTRNKFFNPVWQNAGHISAIEKLLGEEFGGVCRNIVVFSERCSLKNIMLNSKDVHVIKRNALRKTVRELSTTDVLSASKIAQAAGALREFSNADQAMKQKHVEAIQAQVGGRSEQSANKTSIGAIGISPAPVCPKCGAAMVKRAASRGANAGSEFWGCSRYPKCRGIINCK